jgi:hypothetical protein
MVRNPLHYKLLSHLSLISIQFFFNLQADPCKLSISKNFKKNSFMKINQIFICLLNLLNSCMTKNLRSACLLILVFLFFTAGFVGLVSAADYNYSFTHFNESNYSSKWGDLSSPTSEYDIWGYTGKDYNFSTHFAENSTLPLESSKNTTMVFYWNCSGKTYNPNDLTRLPINNTNKDNKSWNSSHKWDNNGTYYASVGIFQNETPVNISYWVPIYIVNETYITVQNVSMLGENERFNCNSTYYNNSKYCGYMNNDYSFSVTLSATSRASKDKRNLTREDIRTINETITEVNWGDNTSANSLNIDNSYDSNTEGVSISAGNFTHEWNSTGEKNISTSAFHWDPLDGKRRYSQINNTSSILIIRDPKNFVLIDQNFQHPSRYVSFIIGVFSNLQSWGILLSILGLVIFYFTYTRNNVPIKIALFGMKPFYLKSVNSLTGTLIFVAGMYLYFIFGRCPWDIPIINGLPNLSDMYFGILYREYETKPLPNIPGMPNTPYLSILIGMLNVIISSLIIHLIAIPFYKGEFKIGEFLRRRLSATSAQSELVSYSDENKISQEN